MSYTIAWYHYDLAIGGAQVNSMELATHLVQRGHRVFFLAEDGELREEIAKRGINFKRVKYYDFYHPSYDSVMAIKQLVERHNVDVLWTASYVCSLEAPIVEVLTDAVHVPLFGSPATPHTYIPKWGPVGWVNPHHRDYFVGQLGWQDQDVHLIIGRMDTEKYRPASVENGWLDSQPQVITSKKKVVLIGSVSTPKLGSIDLFLDGAEQILQRRQDVQFILVGDGDQRDTILKRAESINRRLGAPLVLVPGETTAVEEVMNKADILCGMASTCIISLLCGRPTIVLGNRGFSEIAEPETIDHLAYHHFNLHEDSQLVQPNAFVAQLGALLDAPKRRRELGTWGRQYAASRYSVTTGVESLEALFETAIEHRRSLSRADKLKRYVELARGLVSLGGFRTKRRLGLIGRRG